MVSTIDHLATQAGLGVLRDGGSAADAAIAANAVLTVTMPNLCGMGGDLFALVSRDDAPRRPSTPRGAPVPEPTPRACAPKVGTRCRSSSTFAR